MNSMLLIFFLCSGKVEPDRETQETTDGTFREYFEYFITKGKIRLAFIFVYL